ncbi:homoserine kinase [Catenovulum agarivorans DS-2]|uniref:Homoserine kinase n=1 Tax=Catenovulum agarivorans DS-2 TaxID=1328313 RepID=W7QHV2_9ALTE|nr:homoserine kinase [Catenovulum agarivorans]EWH08507.1 homoserine kinase [Catenovulum agarivorans DS-2]
MSVTAYAPASTGNVSLGFDILGLALKPIDGSLLGDRVTVVQEQESFSLTNAGRFAHKLPTDATQNIVYDCFLGFKDALADLGIDVRPVEMVLEKNLPIGSGLGSSASSIVAALAALNGFYGNPLNQEQLLRLMGKLEGQISGSIHYDNVAPCYLGGLQLMVESDEQISLSLPVFDDWYWVICYSGASVSTAAARDILPKEYDRATTINFGRQLAVFVDALHRKDKVLAAQMMQDVIAEPYRKSLLQNFDAGRAFAQEQGALAFGISGSGPTVFAAVESLDAAEEIKQWLVDNYIQNEDGFAHVCQVDGQGTQVSEDV